ncbi:flavin-containing monooxygenase [Tsukamurella tyrosinosolvens]|uniref:flavin-containing monooxygenase n=1 Tax=Tsukamurella tyrosinosolvens TaxID=57704 RepID=UPI000DF7031A|nr:NAD(P)/FAD-dependent oxidoreductase [Tsukamurella tyrosinosolvens]RDB46570.1 NAD(P)/FAD-dependent oxidoreductase [Tsukamurella tyrosinosolvens]
MNTATPHHGDTPAADVDVVLIGAGISGIGAAHHLATERPNDSFVVLDGGSALGGTWNLFRYPGIRSDSDMPSFGFGFKPWTHSQSIADAHVILDYLNQAVDESSVRERIRFHTRVTSADFDTRTGLWSVHTADTRTGETGVVTARFVYSGTGYYNHAAGYTPEFAGLDRFDGTVIHPQHWPEDLDYTGKKVVVIGSGATAVTLIPAMAGRAEHVTMLQRSPSYVFSLPREDAIANTLNRFLGPERAHRIVRRKNITLNRSLFKASQRAPGLVRRALIADVKRRLPKGFDVDTHFAPKYDPWDQRLCMVPNGDLFKAISSGDASVVTDRVETFTPTGIALASGQHLDADIVITATGLDLLPFGGIEYSVDGVPVDVADTVIYKSMMLSGIPNLVFAFGYTNLAWTLKVDLVCKHMIRLLDLMEQRGHTVVVPIVPEADVERSPMIDMSSGYIQRGIAHFPKAGDRGPWTVKMAYEDDVARLVDGPVEDDALAFSTPAPQAVTA